MAVRTTHAHDGDLTVFLIGMRFNKLWRIDAWLPAFLAMPKMLRELSMDKESGFLGYRLLLGELGVTVVQYWRDTAAVYAYANDAARGHRPEWLAFHARAKKIPGAVGIWHETYQVAQAESIYVDMPVTGLAKATTSVPVGSGRHTARERISRTAAS